MLKSVTAFRLRQISLEWPAQDALVLSLLLSLFLIYEVLRLDLFVVVLRSREGLPLRDYWMDKTRFKGHDWGYSPVKQL